MFAPKTSSSPRSLCSDRSSYMVAPPLMHTVWLSIPRLVRVIPNPPGPTAYSRSAASQALLGFPGVAHERFGRQPNRALPDGSGIILGALVLLSLSLIFQQPTRVLAHSVTVFDETIESTNNGSRVNVDAPSSPATLSVYVSPGQVRRNHANEYVTNRFSVYCTKTDNSEVVIVYLANFDWDKSGYVGAPSLNIAGCVRIHVGHSSYNVYGGALPGTRPLRITAGCLKVDRRGTLGG